MKKLVPTFLILTLIAGPAFAHCGVCGVGEKKGSDAGAMQKDLKEKAGKMKESADNMFGGLDLTKEQMAKIKALKETKNKAIKAAQDEFSAGFRAVLTPEQLKIFEAMHKDHGHVSKGSKGSH